MWALLCALLALCPLCIGGGRASIAVEMMDAHAFGSLVPSRAEPIFMGLLHEIPVGDGKKQPEIGPAFPERCKFPLVQVYSEIDLYFEGVLLGFWPYDFVWVKGDLHCVGGRPPGKLFGDHEPKRYGREECRGSSVVAKRNIANDRVRRWESAVEHSAIGTAALDRALNSDKLNSEPSGVNDRLLNSHHCTRHGHGGIGTPFRIAQGGSGGIKRLFDKPNTERRYEDASHRCKRSPFGPVCLLPLGVKVLLLAPLIPLGLWIGWRGLLSADYRNTSILHTIQGVFRMLLGAALATLGVIGMLE